MKLPSLALLAVCLLLAGCAHNPQKAARDLLAESQTYRHQGKFKSAEIEIRRALQLQPQSIAAYRALANLELQQQNWTTAYAALREIVNLDPQKVDAWLDLGRLYVRNQEWTEAQKAARTVLTAAGSGTAERAAAHQLLATIAAAQHHPATALDQFQQVTSLTPKDPNAWVNLALAERGAGNSQAAAADLNHAIAVAPHAPLAWVDLVRLQQASHQARAARVTLQRGLAANPGSAALWLQQADLDYDPAHPAAAQHDLAMLLQRQPHSPGAALAAGNWYATHGDRSAALTTFQSGLAAHPAFAPLQQAMLHAYLAAGQWQQAQALSRKILNQQPHDEAALLAQARMQIVRGQTAKALPVLQTLAQQYPSSAAVFYSLGQAEWQTGDLAHGLQHEQRANVLQPDQPACLKLLCRMELASGDTDSALHFANLYRQFAADAAEAHRLLGEVALRAGASKQAVHEFTAAGLASSSSAADHLLLAQAAQSAGQLSLALRQYQQALTLQPGSAAITGDIVHVQAVQQHWSAAQATIAAYASAHPRAAAGPWLAATLAIAQHQDAAAARNLHRALTLQPGFLQAELGLGRLRQQQGNWQRALYWYQQALQQQPDFAPLLTLIGNLYLQQRQWNQAKAYYRRALTAHPGFALAEANLAWVESQQNQNLNDALSWAQRAAKSAPHQPSVQDTLGWVYYKLGSYQTALPILVACVAAAPRTPIYHFHLGMTQIAAGQRHDGAAQLRQALALDLAPPAAGQARAALRAARR